MSVARAVERLPPAALRRLLEVVRTGAAPAGAAETLAARTAVTAVSLHCAGEGCVPRSVATAVLCRLRGTWPDWYVGVRTEPFAAHAWVEVDGEPVGELHPAGYYVPVLSVPAAGRRR